MIDRVDRPKVLLVDDDISFLELVKLYIGERYQVTTATDGHDIFDKLKSQVPDIVVLDVMMPRMDGYQVCKTIKSDERLRHIPVILLTAKSTQVDVEAGEKSGADSYIAKPFDFDELFEAIEKLLSENKRMATC